MDILAIIPARGGSKGLPNKNIKLLKGRPLIVYTIEAAKKSKYINKVVVTTDNEEIANISKEYGAEVPFLRPKELALDDTPSIDSVMHCINWLKNNQNYISDYTCLLQCTSPLRGVEHIDEAIEKLFNQKADSIVGLCKSESSPFWMKIIANDRIKWFIEDGRYYNRRQDLPQTYITNGSIYISKTKKILKNKEWYDKNTIPYIMDRVSSLDIDDIEDFRLAEYYVEKLSL